MRTALSSGPVVGVSSVGVGILAGIFRVGRLPSGFTIAGGISWGGLAVILQVQGVILLAVGGECAGLLAILHAIGLDEVLHERKAQSREQNEKRRQSKKKIKVSELTTRGLCCRVR